MLQIFFSNFQKKYLTTFVYNDSNSSSSKKRKTIGAKTAENQREKKKKSKKQATSEDQSKNNKITMAVCNRYEERMEESNKNAHQNDNLATETLRNEAMALSPTMTNTSTHILVAWTMLWKAHIKMEYHYQQSLKPCDQIVPDDAYYEQQWKHTLMIGNTLKHASAQMEKIMNYYGHNNTKPPLTSSMKSTDLETVSNSSLLKKLGGPLLDKKQLTIELAKVPVKPIHINVKLVTYTFDWNGNKKVENEMKIEDLYKCALVIPITGVKTITQQIKNITNPEDVETDQNVTANDCDVYTWQQLRPILNNAHNKGWTFRPANNTRIVFIWKNYYNFMQKLYDQDE